MALHFYGYKINATRIFNKMQSVENKGNYIDFVGLSVEQLVGLF